MNVVIKTAEPFENNILFLNRDIFRAGERTLQFKIKGYLITIDNLDTSKSLNDFMISIITIKDFRYDPERMDIPSSKNTVRRLHEILSSLKSGKVIILFVEEPDPLLQNLLKELKIESDSGHDYIAIPDYYISNFEGFVRGYCNYNLTFRSEEIMPICNYKGKCCGFHMTVGKGKLYVLPTIIHNTNRDFYIPLIRELLTAIASLDLEYHIPKYLNEYKLLDEETLTQEKHEAQDKIIDIDKTLEKYKKIKSIMVLKSDKLVENVLFTFAEIGTKTLRVERYEEDFWIMEDNEKSVIGEIRGSNKNFERKMINDLDNHREMNRLPDDFPALVIANTFSDEGSFLDKNKEPSGDTIRLAKAHNMMIMRTLDLFNLYQLIKQGEFDINSFIEILKGKEYGWIRVNSEINVI